MGQYSAGAGMIRQPPISYNYMPGALLIELPDLFFFAFFDFELVMSLIEEIFKISLYTGETNLCCKEKSRNREVHMITIHSILLASQIMSFSLENYLPSVYCIS